MKIIFRVDGGFKIGMGHIIRCISIYNAFKKRFNDLEAFFLIKKEADGISFLRKKHFKIISHLSIKPNLVILDINNPKEEDLKIFKNYPLVCIDSNNLAEKYADILIDANKENKDTSSKPKRLYGSDYVVIREEFLPYRETKSKKDKILITFGGSDPLNLTEKVLLLLKDLENLEFNVIIGPSAKVSISNIEKIIKNAKSKFNLFFNPDNLVDIFSETFLAISSGGITLYELAYLGIPSIIISQAKHQIAIAEKFEKLKVGINLGMGDKVKKEKLIKVLLELLENPLRRNLMSKKAKDLVDGKGLERIINEISAVL